VHIGQHQHQLHPAAFEVQQVDVGRGQRPGFHQLASQVGQGAVLVEAGGVGAGQRVLFDRDKHQPLAALRVAAPGLPGGQEVVAQAKAGLQDDKTRLTRPAPGQAAAMQKDLLGLRQRAGIAVMDVAKLWGAGGAVLPEGQPRRGDRCKRHGAMMPALLRAARHGATAPCLQAWRRWPA